MKIASSPLDKRGLQGGLGVTPRQCCLDRPPGASRHPSDGGIFKENSLTYDRKEQSLVLIGRPGTFTPADRFPISNVVITPDRYSYEGNWLFCTFTQSEIVAARIGFGRGKMDWRDYGLDEAPTSENSLFTRIEIITARGIYAYLSSDPNLGQALHSSATGLDIRLLSGPSRLDPHCGLARHALAISERRRHSRG